MGGMGMGGMGMGGMGGMGGGMGMGSSMGQSMSMGGIGGNVPPPSSFSVRLTGPAPSPILINPTQFQQQQPQGVILAGSAARPGGYVISAQQPAIMIVGGGTPGLGAQIEKDVRSAWKQDQVKTLLSACQSLNPALTADECGLIVKALWKENQVEGARIMQRYCSDAHGFRQAMKNQMWHFEFEKLGL